MKQGNVSERDMFNTFNMGVGMVMIVSEDTVQEAMNSLKANGVDAYTVGEVINSDKKVVLEGCR